MRLHLAFGRNVLAEQQRGVEGTVRYTQGRLGVDPRVALPMHHGPLLLVGDNPERIHSEAAFAKLCGACPIPASSGKTNRHRLNRGATGRPTRPFTAWSSFVCAATSRTLDYVRRRTAEGKSKSEIIRCLKRYVAREISGYLCIKAALKNAPAASP